MTSYNMLSLSEEHLSDPMPLHNTGAICYFNSLIQALSAQTSLIEYMKLYEKEFKEINNILAIKFNEFINARKANSPTQNYSEMILRALVMEKNSKRRNTIRFGIGQDGASLAFDFFIECLNATDITNLFTIKYRYTIKCNSCEKEVSRIEDKSLKVNLFYNVKINPKLYFAHREKLNPRIQRINEDPNRKSFTVDSIKTMADAESYASDMFVRTILKHSSPLEDYKCEHCGKKVKNERVETLVMLREVIVITFNKYQKKDNRWFPKSLSFMGKDGNPLKYELTAQIEHSGLVKLGKVNGSSYSSGHYWAIVRGKNGKVFRCNDSSISPGKFGPTPNTYIIMYHRVG